MADSTRRVLYVSYDGALEPLGGSQVVAYLERLAARETITLLSFEKPRDLADAAQVAAMRTRLSRAGVVWIARRYHKQPSVLSTVYDVLVGCLTARRWARQGPPGIVHARGYVSALIALDTKRAAGSRFLFDMRGFWIDEKVEAGHWKRGGVLHRLGKRWERRFFESADAIVSLTHAGVREFPTLGRPRPGVPVFVIPTCADLDRFRPDPDPAADAQVAARHRALKLDGAIVVGSVGTLSNWYLREDTLKYLAWLAGRMERVKVLVVTREDHAALRADAIRAGVPADRLVIISAPFDEMPSWIRMMDVGVFFIRAGFSKRASAATKLAEFLGCGVPVVINDGIGDSGDVVRRGRAGLVLAETTPDAFEASAPDLDALLVEPDVRQRCRDVALREFSLDRGVASYEALYARLRRGDRRDGMIEDAEASPIHD